MKQPPWARVAVTALLAGALVLTLGSPAQAGPADDRGGCKPSVSSALRWDHYDPLAIVMFADGTINNCNGVIKEVRLNAVVVAPNGSVEDSLSAGWEITPKPRGVTKYDGGGFFIGGSHNKRPPALLNMNHVNAFEPEYTMRACAYEVDDYERNIAGYTFYTIITAHNKKGREIARYVSPPVACDQNG